MTHVIEVSSRSQVVEVSAAGTPGPGPTQNTVTVAQMNAAISAALAAYQENPNLVSWQNDGTAHTLTLTGRDADGNAIHEAISYGGTGQSGLTLTAAVNGGMAKLASELPTWFAWNAATDTPTATP